MGRLTTAPPQLPPAIARQRNAILAVLIGLAAAGWAVFVAQARQQTSMGMSGGMHAGPDLTMGGSAPLFFAMWVAMMVAMMFPAAAPMVVMYGRTQRSHPERIAAFTGSYIALWIAFGAIAFGLGAAVEHFASRSEWIGMNWARGGGALIVAAGVWQLTPLKDLCLKHCRSPLGFVMTRWRDGMAGALRMGAEHGLYCMGCCWLFFLILVPLGLMNVAAMIVVALVVFVEKVLPWGRGIGRIAAIGLVAYGIAVFVHPALLPTVA